MKRNERSSVLVVDYVLRADEAAIPISIHKVSKKLVSCANAKFLETDPIASILPPPDSLYLEGRQSSECGLMYYAQTGPLGVPA